MGLLYGRAGRLTALCGGFRPGQWPGCGRRSCGTTAGPRRQVAPDDHTKLICTAALWVNPMAAPRSFFVCARKLVQKHTSLPGGHRRHCRPRRTTRSQSLRLAVCRDIVFLQTALFIRGDPYRVERPAGKWPYHPRLISGGRDPHRRRTVHCVVARLALDVKVILAPPCIFH
jgi:hypothetical protein